MESVVIIVFIIGYLAIALEHPLKINKTATALLTGVACWTIYAVFGPNDILVQSDHYSNAINAEGQSEIYSPFHLFVVTELGHFLSDIAGILFFLMGAMTIVELIDAHQGFRIITDRITTKNIRILLWIVCWLAFFLSSVLDNLTTAIVMVSLIRKLIIEKNVRLLFAGMIIIAANAGGAWSPIGDVTTTMLWIGGQITSGSIIKSVFMPSVICLLTPLIYLSFTLKGNLMEGFIYPEAQGKGRSKTILFFGIGALIFVPIFKTFTHLPPYMGMLLGLGVLWVVSEIINPHADEGERKQFSAGYALSRIDIPSVLFFLGILLAVGALESMMILHNFADQLAHSLGDNRIIISLVGIVSAIVDNVPLVAACMGMYSLETYPVNDMIWTYLAFCAGTGGSLLVIGSAAGVAVMGMEQIDFIWYLKKISWLAFLGYCSGAGYFLLFN